MKKHLNTILIFLLAGLCSFLLWNSLKPNQELANLKDQITEKELKVTNLQREYESTLEALKLQKNVSDSLEQEIAKNKNQLTVISGKYESLRQDLNTYTIDGHIEFFGTWTETFNY